MMTIVPSSLDNRRRTLSMALRRVLGPTQRAAVHELVLAERGVRRASPHEVLSWMRVNMPSHAGRVDDVIFPEPFRD